MLKTNGPTLFGKPICQFKNYSTTSSSVPQQQHVLQQQQHPAAAAFKSCPNDFLESFVIFIIKGFS
jgi:hypothetical protein